MARESLFEKAEQPLVLFDGDDAAPGIGERLREHSVARAWFDDEVAGRQRHAIDDAARDRSIAQEVLREVGTALIDTRIDATHDVPPARWRRDVAHDERYSNERAASTPSAGT